MNYIRSIGGALALAGFAAPHLKAATVFTDSVTFFSSSLPGTEVIMAWTQAGATGDGGGIIVYVDQGQALVANAGTAGIGYAWYSVNEGTSVGPDLVNSTTPFAGISVGQPTFLPENSLQLQEGQDFLLGIWLDANEDLIPDANDRFGWVRLDYTTADGLKIVDSAISVSDPILAGTLITVPEASSLMIAGLAGGMLLRRRRNA